MKSTQENILFLSSWSYDEPLAHSYFLANIRIIRKIVPADVKIFVQTLEKNTAAQNLEIRRAIEKTLASENIIWVPLRYHQFSIKALLAYQWSFAKLLWLVWTNKIKVLHAFAPAAGTAALLLKQFTGKKFIIDSWEPHADCMVETGVWKKTSLAYRILRWSEKHQCEQADVLLAASPGMKNFAEKNLGIVRGLILHRPACVDTDVFSPNQEQRNAYRMKMNWEDKTVCVCVSKLGGLYMREDVFRFFVSGLRVFGENFHALLISANSQEEVESLRIAAKFPASQLTHITISHQEIPGWLNACDFSFNPQMPVPSKRFGTPVKDGEYWACGLPIVIMPDISDDSKIVEEENAGVVMKSLTEEAMIQAMQSMNQLLKQETDIRQRMHQIAIKYRSYEIARKAYRMIYG